MEVGVLSPWLLPEATLEYFIVPTLNMSVIMSNVV